MQAKLTSRVRGIFTGDTSIMTAALAELKVARQTLPNDPQILFLTSLIQRRQGRWEESIRTLERTADLDPAQFWGATGSCRKLRDSWALC